jgi:hypothetical protein
MAKPKKAQKAVTYLYDAIDHATELLDKDYYRKISAKEAGEIYGVLRLLRHLMLDAVFELDATSGRFIKRKIQDIDRQK